jgi:hypothetical protein
MVAALAGVGLGIGALAAVVSYALPTLSGRPPTERPRPLLLAVGLGLTLVLFLLTLPTTPPFSPGQRLGLGFLIGGMLGLLATAGSARLARREEAYWPYPHVFALSLALAAVSLALLCFRGDPEEALLGCALGFGMVAGLIRLAGSDATFALEPAAVLAATLVAGSLLAVYHFDTPSQRGWWGFPVALAGAWALALAIAYAGRRLGALLPMLTGLLAAVLTLLVGGLLDRRLGAQEGMVPLLLFSFVTAALIVWLTTASQDAPSPVRSRAAALATLLLLFLLVLSFKLLQALGTAIALLAVWAIIAPSLNRGRAWAPVQLLIVGANFLLLRLFLERIGASPGDVQPDLHYTLIGLALGVLLPTLSLSLYEPPGVGRALAVGLIATGAPLALVALWGPDAAVGFLLGLIVAPALTALLGLEADSWLAPAGLVSLGMALVTVQFSRVFADLYQLPRVYKACLAGGIALLVLLWIAGLGLARLRASRRAAGEG